MCRIVLILHIPLHTILLCYRVYSLNWSRSGIKTPVYLHALSTAKDARSLPPTPNQHRGVNGVPNSSNKPQGRGKDI